MKLNQTSLAGTAKQTGMTTHRKLQATGHAGVIVDLTRFARIQLHLRCLLRDHKYRWHLSGVWRELRAR
jgi:hypothetical protein